MLPSLRSTYNKTDLIQAETKILVLVIDYYLTPIVFFLLKTITYRFMKVAETVATNKMSRAKHAKSRLVTLFGTLL